MGLTKEDTLLEAYAIRGELWPTEMGWLYDELYYSRSHIEIGSFCGRSAYVVGCAMGRGTLTAVDPLDLTTMPGYREPCAHWTERQLEMSLHALQSQTSLNVKHWYQTSLDAFNRAVALGLMFDSCFIDANHHYAECKADIEMWRTRVKPGGLLCGHDFWGIHTGVMEAVSEVLQGDFYVPKNTRIWVHKAK